MSKQKESEKKKCFVIMPFTVKKIDLPRYQDSNHWKEVYEGLIFPAVTNVELDCDREDQDIGSRLIVKSILTKIEYADIILCDLSSHNPNVFFELGWALRKDKPFVLIKDELTDYNFDFNQQYIFDYKSTLQPTVLKEKIIELQAIISKTLNDPERRYSIVKDLALSISSIEAIKGDDLNTKLLSEIIQVLEQSALRAN